VFGCFCADEYTALEPHISKRTLEFHHDKHHAKYVATTNELIKGSELETASLEEIVKASKGAWWWWSSCVVLMGV
jgi:superoxide dismutase, Fe-Mn family